MIYTCPACGNQLGAIVLLVDPPKLQYKCENPSCKALFTQKAIFGSVDTVPLPLDKYERTDSI